MWRIAQGQHQQQHADRGKADDHETVDIGQHVRLFLHREVEQRESAGVGDVGGFLGVGTRRVAVAWHLLRFEHDADETRVHMELTFDSAAAAPEYQGPDNTLIVIDRAAP